jgi:hypothetical protein
MVRRVLECRHVLDIEPEDLGVPHRHLHLTHGLAVLVAFLPRLEHE